ncbi:AfsA-related hotdog domain-containing protein [Microbacterium sp. NPDC077663]|uniref:AfsA-related hotdog domain-containing protein n=1 Tax=Microbacterium sp. NPDC077663 TaxID=3364189 RepID=UPI0037CADB39
MIKTYPLPRDAHRGRRDDEPTLLPLQSLVHKRVADEVLLAWASPRSGGAWAFGIDLPHRHSSNARGRATVPLISGLEIVRQLGLAIGHLHANVPIDWAYTLQKARFQWLSEPCGFDLDERFRPTAIVTVEDVVLRRGQVSGLVARTDLSLHGEAIAVGSGELKCFTPETYRLLRRRLVRQPAVPKEATTADLRDVNIGVSEVNARLGWPSHDRFLFDHATDHIPGMLLARGAVAAHTELAAGEPDASIAVECYRFAELDDEVQVHAQELRGHVVTEMQQGPHIVARVRTA